MCVTVEGDLGCVCFWYEDQVIFLLNVCRDLLGNLLRELFCDLEGRRGDLQVGAGVVTTLTRGRIVDPQETGRRDHSVCLFVCVCVCVCVCA